MHSVIYCYMNVPSTCMSFTFVVYFTLVFFDHVMRKEVLESIVTTGKTSGRKGKDRPGEIMLDGLIR